MVKGKILRGFVYEKDGGAPIPYANIVIEEDRLGATTDFNGYFQISDVPVGLKEITVSYLGYEIQKVEARVFKHKPASIKVYLEESVEMLNTVDINVARLQRKIKVNTAVVSLNPKNIETFSAGGDPDLMKALAVLPWGGNHRRSRWPIVYTWWSTNTKPGFTRRNDYLQPLS